MKIDVSQQAANFSRKHSRMSKWRKVVTTMAIIVVFCTTYALILPAITMEKDATCGIELHEHTEACFAPAQAYLACEFVQADVDAAQIVIHTHDEFCYDADGNLLCTLEEVRAHRHTPDCYQTVENTNVEAHAHEEGCYQLQRGELICTETERDGHVHSDSCGCYIYSQALICDIEETAGHRHSAEAGCYQDTTVLVCTLAETAGHVHGESCRDAEGNIICTLAEVNAHAHGTDCYRTESNLVCTLQEAEAHSHGTDCYSTNAELVCELAEDAGHVHEDACYAWENVLICSQGASAAEEQILVCDRSELGPHEHSAECSGPDGSLICGAAEAVAHQHDESCFAQPDPEAEPEVICGMEEHVHDDVLCYIDLTADLETRTQWEATLPDELSGDWHKDFLAVAKSQLGYRESDVNIVVDEDGVARGYTRYGAWYGAPYSDWCAMYVSFCLNYAEIPETEIPQRAACQRWIEVLCRDEYDLFRSTDEYMPVPGDIVFFDWEEDGHSDHVGIVYEILKEDGVAHGIRTIEGNSGNTVRYQTYKLDDPCLVGYAQLPEKPVEEPEADSDMAEEPAVESDTAEEQENSFEVADDAENNSETDEETIIDPKASEETENDSETDEEQINDSEVAEEMEGNPEVEGEAELAPEADGEIEADEEAELNPDAGEELVSDPEADVETAEQWEATLPDGLGGSWRDDLLAVAQSQVGYRESNLNFEVGEDGIARGYTRYGAWCGMPYADWSAMFASFCLNYAGVPDDVISGEIDCAQWVENLQQKEDGVFYAANEYIPVSGDLVFFDHDGDGIADHVGIASGVNEGTETEAGTLNAIEGDSENSVREVNCSLNDAAIIGYTMLGEAELAQPESDPEADIETAEQWEATLPGAPGGIWREDLLAVAYSQLGYSESTLNFETDEDGVVRGYTRYGAWYGDPYGDWDAMFVSFCLNYAGISRDIVPYEAESQNWIDVLNGEERDLYRAAGEYIPVPGDLIFFDLDGDGCSERTGIVCEFAIGDEGEPAGIRTIEGDFFDSVCIMDYELSNPALIGYGVLPEQKIQRTLIAQIYLDNEYMQPAEDDGTHITVTGYLPADAHVKAYPVQLDMEDAPVCAYDIEIFLADGTVFEPESADVLTVAIESAALASEAIGEDLRLEAYYVPEEGEPEKIESFETEEGIAFDTNHFSVYMVRAVDDEEVRTQWDLQEAINGGESYIKLTGDFDVNIGKDIDGNGMLESSLALPENSNITLDLNGHILRHNGNGPLFIVPAGTVLTIVDSQQGLAAEDDTDLSYKVTTSHVVDSGIGSTSETTETIRVSTRGSIVGIQNSPMGEKRPIISVQGGTFNLQSGMLRDGTSRAIVQTAGTTNISGGYICGFEQPYNTETYVYGTDLLYSSEDFGGALHVTGGTLNLSGSGVIAGNTAASGGAIYLGGRSSMNITGGVLSGNKALYTCEAWKGEHDGAVTGGGAICAAGYSHVSMSRGYITNNTSDCNQYFDGGGGVLLKGNASMTLSGGYITGNIAQGGGGIRTSFNAHNTFNMSGGFVSANTATTSEGGGIAVDRGTTSTITGGHVTNNNITNTIHWGGGGLFCADGSTMNLKNALITDNDAGGFGGGVAGCPTGKLYLYVDEGCAIFDNSATVDEEPHYVNGGAKDGIDVEICDEIFRNNGNKDYFCALNSTVTGIMLGGGTVGWQGTADGSVVQAEREDLLSATRVMGLEAHPTNSAKQAAQNEAKLYINGNYSFTHGGGIMCNGNLVVGNPEDIEEPARIQLQTQKMLLDSNGAEQPLEGYDFSFKVTMTDVNGEVIANGVCEADGTITFDSQLVFKENGDYVYYVYETPGEGETSIIYDGTLYRLTVKVERDEGQNWYGDTKKYSYEIKNLLIEKSLDHGNSWEKVSETDKVQSGIINLSLTDEGKATFVNYLADFTEITVRKQWSGGVGADSVTVILKKNGEEIDRQELSEANNWSYKWENLESGYEYTVEEIPVAGYEPTYRIITEEGEQSQTTLTGNSWWVPADDFVAGGQYMIVSADGSKALMISSDHENAHFTAQDMIKIDNAFKGEIRVDGKAYGMIIPNTGINSRSIFTAETTTKGNHSGLILKCNGSTKNSWLLCQGSDNNHLKSTSGANYASIATFDGTYLRFHDNYEWNPNNLLITFFDGTKFNTTKNSAPENAARLFTLVSGTATQGTVSSDAVMVITNTYKEHFGDLTIGKTVEGDAEDMKKAFRFTVTLANDTKDLSGSYSAMRTYADGSTARETVTFTENTATISLSHGQSLRISSIPEGTAWTVTEEATGYRASYIVDGGASVEGTTVGGIIAEGTNVAFTNSAFYVLPETGGSGTQMYTAGGAALILLAVILLYNHNRRRKEDYESS